MGLDSYITLGRSGLRVSPLALGTMTFGVDWGWGAGVDACEALIVRYVELGGNFVDTANFYTYGHAEKILGDHLHSRPGLRERLVIATKFYNNMHTGDPNGGGAGRKAILAQIEQSLRRLRTDYVDVYWLHMHDRHTPIEETLRTLDDLVTSGKVRYLGFSDTPAWKGDGRTDHRPLPRLDAAHCNAIRVLVERAHRRGGSRPDVSGPRPRGHDLGSTQGQPLSGKFDRSNISTRTSDRGSRRTPGSP